MRGKGGHGQRRPYNRRDEPVTEGETSPDIIPILQAKAPLHQPALVGGRDMPRSPRFLIKLIKRVWPTPRERKEFGPKRSVTGALL